MEKQAWHALKVDEAIFLLHTSRAGLMAQDARARLEKCGLNQIAEVKRDPWYVMLFSQFKSLPIIMLIAAAAISFALGFSIDAHKLVDAVAITIAILLAVFFGFFQEYKAEKAMEALRKMTVPHSVVVRSGKETLISSSDLVPGDIVILEEGSMVPADMRLLEATNLAADQSMLTGESRPSSKHEHHLPEKTVLSERKNMLFSGTVVVRGHCRGLVVETGMRTEFGKIVNLVSQPEGKETTLQRDLGELSKNLGYAGIALAAVFFAVGMLRGETIFDMFVVAVTLAVAVIPEGLPTVLAITLAIGVQKMARKNAIVRKMPAVETLGSATVICTDKTGTITQNRMAVEEIVLAEKEYSIGAGGLRSSPARDPVLMRALEVMELCNNALFIEEHGVRRPSGDPTEVALLSAALSCRGGRGPLRSEHKQIGEVPFDSDRKMMSSIREYGNGRMAFVKGAPERIIPRCRKIMLSKGEAQMSGKWRERMLSKSQSMGEEGMRVLALAYRPIGKMAKYSSQNTERELVLVGLVSMDDPPRPEVPQAISLCRSAGVRVIMLTGDSLPTARSIAAKVGLLDSGQKAYDSSQVDRMSEDELRKVVYSAGVFARVTPEQKYRIVDALIKSGEIVAVTGDGVNDAPAIRRAHIGIAMGITGTDVTKEVSDVVLLDDNFASIMHAIRYGRTIFNNIKGFVRYQISTNVAALLLMFGTPALGLPVPLLPLEILWINIIVDGPPALALGAEPPRHTEMEKPPRDPKAPFMSQNLINSIIFLGLTMAAISLVAFAYFQKFEPGKSFTAVFTLFVFLQLANALNCRSASQSIFKRFFSNPYLLLAIALSLLLQMVIVYWQPMQDVFSTVALSLQDLALLACLALLVVFAEELKKKLFARATDY